jgi:long-subunit acyl-CoA synthetase (AMP-forming)
MALPRARLRIAANGEIEIGGSLMIGYLEPDGSVVPTGPWYRTGDIGSIDDDGFVHVDGRLKDVLVTSYGRNVSPEWVESELQATADGRLRAVVLGDRQPHLGAVLWSPSIVADDVLSAIVEKTNTRLPDYARVARWVRARHAFDATSGMATPNGRPRRSAIAEAYRTSLFTHPEPA